MSNHTKLDRAYFSLIDGCNDCVSLANAIAANANYKDEIQAATNHLIVDCCKEAMRMRRILQEVIERQQQASDWKIDL